MNNFLEENLKEVNLKISSSMKEATDWSKIIASSVLVYACSYAFYIFELHNFLANKEGYNFIIPIILSVLFIIMNLAIINFHKKIFIGKGEINTDDDKEIEMVIKKVNKKVNLLLCVFVILFVGFFAFLFGFYNVYSSDFANTLVNKEKLNTIEITGLIFLISPIITLMGIKSYLDGSVEIINVYQKLREIKVTD